MNVSQLLFAVHPPAEPTTGTIAGRCLLCGEHTDVGVNMKKVVSSNFMSWNRLSAGDCICPPCAWIFQDKVFRINSWVVSETGFRTLQRTDVLPACARAGWAADRNRGG